MISDERMLSLNDRIEVALKATVRRTGWHVPVLFLLETDSDVRVPVTDDERLIMELLLRSERSTPGEFRERVFARLPHVRDAVREMLRQTEVYRGVVRALGPGAGKERSDARKGYGVFIALHGLLPLSAMAPDEVGASWTLFRSTDGDDDPDPDPYPGLRIKFCKGGDFDWTWNWHGGRKRAFRSEPEAPLDAVGPLDARLEDMNDWIEPMGLSFRHGALHLVLRAFRHDYCDSAEVLVTRNVDVALRLLGFDRPSEIVDALAKNKRERIPPALLCSSRLFTPDVLRRRSGKFGTGASSIQTFAVHAFPDYEKASGRASEAKLMQLRDAMRERAFEAVPGDPGMPGMPGVREAYERAVARARMLADVEDAILHADGGIDAFERANEADDKDRSFDLRHAAVDRWQKFVLLRGLLPLSRADPKAALADWVAFRDELLRRPLSLAPHDWINLFSFREESLGCGPLGPQSRVAP